MKCKACNYRNPNKDGFCKKCLKIRAEIRLAKQKDQEMRK